MSRVFVGRILGGMLVSLVLLAALSSMSAVAQQPPGRNPGPCPSGSAPVNGSCGSPSNGGSMNGTARSEVWRSRYGAIAATVDRSIIGVSSDQTSMRAAKKLALKKCAEKECRIVSGYANSCAAIGTGKGGLHGLRTISGGDTQSEAESKVLALCEKSGGVQCEVEYIGCSLPVRVQ